MINENKGGVYAPKPIYNRKLVRNIIKNKIVQKYGLHNVNEYMHNAFENLKEHKKNNKEEK